MPNTSDRSANEITASDAFGCAVVGLIVLVVIALFVAPYVYIILTGRSDLLRSRGPLPWQ